MTSNSGRETEPKIPSESSSDVGSWQKAVLSWVLPLQVCALLGAFVFFGGGEEMQSTGGGVSVLGWVCPAGSSLVLVVVLAGAVGGAIHATSSFVGYVGARQFVASWFVWYLLRAPIGAGLALMVYMALRAGLMGSGASDVNTFGFVAIALLTGMFNFQAIEKLKKVAEAVFTAVPAGADAINRRKAPELTGIQPTTAPAGVDLALKLSGTNFDADTRALIDKIEYTPVRWTVGSLEVTVPGSALVAGTKMSVVVVARAGATERSMEFTLTVP